MSVKNKKELKQFPLINKTNCIIYLQRIIATSELCLQKLREYNNSTKKILEKYNKSDKIPQSVYEIEKDKTGSVTCYIVNVLGDAQSNSISYFKYLKQAEKLVKRNVEGIVLVPFSEEIERLCLDFNKMRNWQNHIPESLLTSEIELIKEGKFMPHPINPIELNMRLYVTYDYFEDLYTSNVDFYKAARKIVQMCKKDYSLLIGEPIQIRKVYRETPADLEFLECAKLSSEVQGIKGNIGF